MAKLTVDVIKIDGVGPHPNADRLSLARVGGYLVVTGLDEYKAGDTAVYFPVDSILPLSLQGFLFSGTKMQLSKDRVRATKIRGIVSQGLLASMDTILDYFISIQSIGDIHRVRAGTDLTKALGITKYEPPVKVPRGLGARNPVAKKYCHPAFAKYTSINHLQKYHNMFDFDEMIIITEKLHGTNFRCGWVPWIPRTFFQKIRKIFFGFLSPQWEFVYGSHNVQLQDSSKKGSGAAHGNVYKTIVENHQLKHKIQKGHVWYGEIIGQGIQKDYEYGIVDGVDVYFMDIYDHNIHRYESFDQVKFDVTRTGEKVVPNWIGFFDLIVLLHGLNKPTMRSTLNKGTVAEGLVVRSCREERKLGQRKILKLISEKYLLQRSNTDYH